MFFFFLSGVLYTVKASTEKPESKLTKIYADTASPLLTYTRVTIQHTNTEGHLTIT